MCDDTRVELASLIAEKLCQSIAEHEWPFSIPLTCSFGVTQMTSEEDVSKFFQRADQALYKAKGNGRNRVVTYLEAEAA